MIPSNRFAFKEWAVVCRALAEGIQTIVLRKGGIHEGSEGFRVAHPEFWLFPSQYHQQPEQLTGVGQSLLEGVSRNAPAPGAIPISQYVAVSDAYRLVDEAKLDRLAGLHIWSPETVLQRFSYRDPGLFLLLVRAYSLPASMTLSDSPYFAGCRSWVELPEPLETADLVPAISDAQFNEARDTVLTAIA